MTVYNINLQPQCLPRLGLTLENKLRVHAASLCVTLRRFTDSILKTAYTSAFNTKTSLQLHHVAVHGIVKTFFFFFSLWSTKADWEREGTHCVCILVVVWTMGWRGKKHTCLQINWFGQEASKEELCVVKQACGEAGMSQQKKHHCDHGEDHDAVLTHEHTRARTTRFTRTGSIYYSSCGWTRRWGFWPEFAQSGRCKSLTKALNGDCGLFSFLKPKKKIRWKVTHGRRRRRRQQCQTVAGLSGAEYYYSSSHIVSPSHEHTLPSIRQEILMTHENTSHMSLHKWAVLLRRLRYPQQLFLRDPNEITS